ncbi:MAG: hypothetical protein HGN29_13555 [Asgard group archaeon]|nr:hypothetical protein [Asgard group archaeon]
MIQEQIEMIHIVQSINEIKDYGVPDGRGSKKYLVEYKNHYYPPEYVVSLSNKYISGETLDKSKLRDEDESNAILENLGFTIVDLCSLDTKTLEYLNNQNIVSLTKIHSSENCLKCKNIIKGILEHIYGKIKVDYHVTVGTKPEDFINTKYYDALKNIYELLQSFRGLNDFVQTTRLPTCNFYVINQGKIIEFDESTHFNQLRALTLKNYPEDVNLEFDKNKWLRLCEKTVSKDNNPNYRDEQRAWFDTLKDFLPSMDIQETKSIKSMTRLYTSDFVWCSLNPNEFSKKEHSTLP